jgi:hypothetical protein
VRSEQRRNAELYARGLLEAGARKSLEPIVARLGGGPVEYEALQHFLADSPWDPGVVDRAMSSLGCSRLSIRGRCSSVSRRSKA